MTGAPTLDDARRAFAEELRHVGHVRSEAVVRAFAGVARERFLGPGPWKLFQLAEGYWTTEDADPRRLYHDVVVAIDAERRLNNGQPSLWARLFDRLHIAPGDRVVQIGAGTGYYTAILAEIVGRTGSVWAWEVDGYVIADAIMLASPGAPPCPWPTGRRRRSITATGWCRSTCAPTRSWFFAAPRTRPMSGSTASPRAGACSCR